MSLIQAPRWLLSPGELADLLGIPIATVYGWRYKGEGPRGYRVGRHVRFAVDDVERWLASRRDQEHAS